MATFATLPGDLLTAIASYVDTPHFVVAVAADGDARAAVRRGVDEAERALRGMSIRGAEAFLLQAGQVILRRALGLIICTPLGALCRCAAYEQLLDVLHIVQATGIKQALFPK